MVGSFEFERSDIDLKRAALAQISPTVLTPPKAGSLSLAPSIRVAN